MSTVALFPERDTGDYDQLESPLEDTLKPETLHETTQKEMVQKAQEMTQNSMKQYILLIRLYELKIAEIELERELVEKREHVDYITKETEFKCIKEQRLHKANKRFEQTKMNIQGLFDAQTKAAQDTRECKKRQLKSVFINVSTKEKYDVLHEIERDKVIDGKLFYTHPIVLQKQRLELMQEGVEGLYDDVELPDWALQLVRKRRRAGYTRVRCVD